MQQVDDEKIWKCFCSFLFRVGLGHPRKGSNTLIFQTCSLRTCRRCAVLRTVSGPELSTQAGSMCATKKRHDDCVTGCSKSRHRKNRTIAPIQNLFYRKVHIFLQCFWLHSLLSCSNKICQVEHRLYKVRTKTKLQ